MTLIKNKEFLFEDVTKLKGVGARLSKYLKSKKITKIRDLLLDFPYSYTDRTNLVQLDELEVGKILTVKVKVIKYSFPRIRNLPNKVICEDEKGKINIVFFNSREIYIKKILPLNSWVIISGKINYFKNNYQITNPNYIDKIQKINTIKKKIPKYNLTEGLTEKTYRKIIEQVLRDLPELNEWYGKNVLKKFKFETWKSSIINMHNVSIKKDIKSKYFRRLVLDEIISNLIILSKNRNIIKTQKIKKKFDNSSAHDFIANLNFNLTDDQKKVIREINEDLISDKRMFRILQGDVGSGKTIVSLITLANAIKAGFQTSLMAPTDILAKQHYELSKKIFKNSQIKISYLSGKSDPKERKNTLEKINSGETDLLIGTHALFQKKIKFKNLGYVVIDEQHKFGVRQRMDLAKKGGKNCDVLLMSAMPIPRTMILSLYGDMDVSKLIQKPKNRLPIQTYSKPEKKINELVDLIKSNIKNDNQIFWVCPLIKESKFLNYSSAIKRYDWLKNIFSEEVGIIHGSIKKEEKEKILNKFLNKKIKILVSTTVIEVGIDFPNANLIIIENANKFGLAQLHQLRGRVGRGSKQGVCVLLYKENLSENSIKRIKILKKTNDGFLIAEEDMKMRGFGDIIGFQQSGEKYFKLADPVRDEDLFVYAEKYLKNMENVDIDKFSFLLKLFDKAEIIN